MKLFHLILFATALLLAACASRKNNIDKSMKNYDKAFDDVDKSLKKHKKTNDKFFNTGGDNSSW